jgi:hypothetical protein
MVKDLLTALKPTGVATACDGEKIFYGREMLE